VSASARTRAWLDVLNERGRQEDKCAEKRDEGLDWHTPASGRLDGEKCLAILVEEVGEVARELCDARADGREPGTNLRVELVQVAAVALAWIEGLDRGEAA
jgi:hypothetical protein